MIETLSVPTQISTEAISNSGVLDIRESLTKLAIIYDGTDLKKANQNLHNTNRGRTTV
jgi:hypothetical protein